MVRFGWHVEDGLGAHILPGEMSAHENTGISHATCSIEVAEDNEPLQAIFTLPQHYLQHDHVRRVGVALAHGDTASDWNGHLLTELAVALAAQGYLVVRYHCASSDETQRQRMYEKALDAAATSPYAGSIDGWVLAGIGSGARVAAAVARRCRGSIVGCAFLSYPLQDAARIAAEAAGNGMPPPIDSAGVLLGLRQPMLFVNGEADGQCPTGLLAQLLLSDQASCKDARLVVLPRVDLRAATGEGRSLPAPVLQQVTAAVSQIVDAVTHGTLEACLLPRLTQQQAAAAPPGSLPPRQAAQPSWQQKPSSLPEAALPMPGNGRGAADGDAPALQPWQQPPQPNSHAHPAPTLQADTGLQAAAPHLAAQGPQQLQRLQPVGNREAMWQHNHVADPNPAAPMQLDAPAAQHSGPPEQHVVPADVMKQSSSPDGMAADAATGATAPSDIISSDYDSDEGQQQVQQEWRPQHSQQLPSPLSQPKQEQPAQHAGMDAKALLQQGHSGHAMPAMQQPAAATLWQQQPPAMQALSFGHQHGATLMPKAEQLMSQHQPQMPRWQQEAAMPFHNQEAAGRPNLQAPEAMQQQQVGQPAALGSIGQLPLEQIWGQGALSSSVLASLMAGHQQSAPSPNFRDP